MTDKTLEQVLKNAIEKAEGALDSGVDFAMAQAPEVIQQAWTWHMTHSIVMNIIGVIFILIFAFIVLRLLKAYKMRPIEKEDPTPNLYWDVDITKYQYSEDSIYISTTKVFDVLFVVCVCSSFLPFVSATMFNLTWLKIWIAPKLWLIEYAASLAK